MFVCMHLCPLTLWGVVWKLLLLVAGCCLLKKSDLSVHKLNLDALQFSKEHQYQMIFSIFIIKGKWSLQ